MKVLYLRVMSFPLIHLSVQRLGNLKMSIVYHSALNIINIKCDYIPLDNSSNKVPISQHCHT